jgi:formamidopyrimidine-DNA glycosylase
MPELPDIVVYLEALERRISGATLARVRLLSPFLLRTVAPPIGAVEGKRVERLRRIGKRIVIGLEGELFLVLHLMIAGRLRWLAPDDKPPGRIALALFEFTPSHPLPLSRSGERGVSGVLALTEAGTKRRASLHLVQGEQALAQFQAGGLEPLACDLAGFAQRLTQENHTLKWALTDPRLFSGIGNAYSDEILHRAKLSPVALTGALSAEQTERLYLATRATLADWTQRLRSAAGAVFPDKVTAFHEGMAVHGRFGQPCPACGAPVQRIVYAENETNYCARCQTGGRILADRSLSRLLKKSWPRDIDELG